MEGFTIRGDAGDFLRISFIEVYGFPNSTCSWGGYEVRAAIEIKSGSYEVTATLWTSTGEMYSLLKGLSTCNEQLSGEVRLVTYEHNLELIVSYDLGGHVTVLGNFTEYLSSGNKLHFQFESDQSYFRSSVAELHAIAAKYGGMKGVKG